MELNCEDFENTVDDSEQVSQSEAATPVVMKDSDTILVETVFAYPALYDKSLKEYHISEIRQSCWEMVAAITNTSVPCCQKRWMQLRDSFKGEKRRRNNEQRSGSGATKRKGFVLYDNMEFLHKHIVQKKTFTNISRPSVATSSAVWMQQSNVRPSPQLGPVHRFPTSTCTMTFQDHTLASEMPGDTNFLTSLELLSSFPPTPESICTTPPPILNIPTPSPEPNTTPTLLASTNPVFPQVQTTNSEALTASSKASSNIQEGPPAFNKVTSTETPTNSRSLNSNVCALSSSLTSIPPRTPTPHSTLLSPVSPYSSGSDVSYTFGPDEVSQTINRPTVAPRTCYTKDFRKAKKIDPVEKSFLCLSSVIQDHFARKPAKQPEMNNTANDNNENAFGCFIATELQKLDEQTKKQKKAQIIRIFYE